MDQTPQFEYKNVTGRFKDKDLNKFSEQGWELVSAKRRTFPVFNPPTDYVFKRIKGTGYDIPPPKKQSLKSLAWIFSILFLVWGIAILNSYIVAAILLILAGVFLFPPIASFYNKNSHKPVTRATRVTLSIICLFFAPIAWIVNLPPEVSTTQPQNYAYVPDATTTESTSTTDTQFAINKNLANQKATQEKAQAAANAAWLATPAGQLCAQHPGWSHANCEAVVNKQVVLGMNEEQVTLVLGKPTHTIVRNDIYIGKSDYWVYGSSGYTKNLYFVNDILKSIQN